MNSATIRLTQRQCHEQHAPIGTDRDIDDPAARAVTACRSTATRSDGARHAVPTGRLPRHFDETGKLNNPPLC